MISHYLQRKMLFTHFVINGLEPFWQSICVGVWGKELFVLLNVTDEFHIQLRNFTET